MNSNEPRTYSVMEPNYLQHFKLMPDGVRVKWDVEVEEPRRYVAGSIAATHDDAMDEAQAAIDKDMDEIAKSFGL